jgi:hypothetical protein
MVGPAENVACAHRLYICSATRPPTPYDKWHKHLAGADTVAMQPLSVVRMDNAAASLLC